MRLPCPDPLLPPVAVYGERGSKRRIKPPLRIRGFEDDAPADPFTTNRERERDERGAPTATRLLVLATYPPEQELSRDDVLVADLLNLPVVDVTPTPLPPTATPLPARDLLHVDVISVVTTDGRITIQLRAYNGQLEPVDIRPEDIAIAFGYARARPDPGRLLTVLSHLHYCPVRRWI